MNSPLVGLRTETPVPFDLASNGLFLDGIAALEPSRITALVDSYDALRRNPPAMAATEANVSRTGGSSNAAGRPYSVIEGGVAVVSCAGPLMQRPGFIMRLLGATDLSDVEFAIASAGADAGVRSIVLAIDSPGGAVNGPPEIAALIETISKTKPVVAWTDGMMASAAYWIASACNSVYGSGPTVAVGSIGVVATHSFRPHSDGGSTTEVATGKFKRIASSTAPLSVEGHAHIQALVDYIGGVFIDAVARGRGVPPAQIRGQEAQTYIGAQGVNAGLLDGLVSLQALVTDMAADPRRYLQRRQKVRGMAATPPRATPNAEAARTALHQASAPTHSADPESTTPEEQKAKATELLTKAYAMHGPSFRVRVQSPEAWGHEASARAQKDGCDFVQAMQRVGFVHSLVSFPPVPAVASKPKLNVPVSAPSATRTPATSATPTARVMPRYSDSPPFSAEEKAEAAQLLDGIRRHRRFFNPASKPAEAWNALALLWAQQERCDFATALKHAGFVHPVLSVLPRQCQENSSLSK